MLLQLNVNTCDSVTVSRAGEMSLQLTEWHHRPRTVNICHQCKLCFSHCICTSTRPTTWRRNQGRFYVGAWGNCPRTSASSPKYDMKHCLTNSRHRHIGAKRSVLWPSKYDKMRRNDLHFHTFTSRPVTSTPHFDLTRSTL